MNKEKMIESVVLGTDISKELYSMLEKIFDYKDTVENVLLLLENDANKQKMIEYLKTGISDKDLIYRKIIDIG